MRIYAYDADYLDSAQKIMGDMLDFAVNSYGFDADDFFSMFLVSDVAEQIEHGNPAYVAGKTGCELVKEIICKSGLVREEIPDAMYLDKSPEYWAGWSLAYYQWKTGMQFREIISHGLTVSKVCSMYLLHEADISKFVEAADKVIQESLSEGETNLKRIRRANGFSQKRLAEVSGVSLRMIQLYEQRQNDINKAQASTLLALARVLNCRLEDLMEPQIAIGG